MNCLMNKKLTNIDYISTTPTNPVTGETWLDMQTGQLRVFDGNGWIEVEAKQDWINIIGERKANAILDQVFLDEEVRNDFPSAQKAWEHYQFTLQMCYNRVNIERKQSNDKVSSDE